MVYFEDFAGVVVVKSLLRLGKSYDEILHGYKMQQDHRSQKGDAGADPCFPVVKGTDIVLSFLVAVNDHDKSNGSSRERKYDSDDAVQHKTNLPPWGRINVSILYHKGGRFSIFFIFGWIYLFIRFLAISTLCVFLGRLYRCVLRDIALYRRIVYGHVIGNRIRSF